MKNNKVVVTGMGAVSGAGVGVAALWAAARSGQSAVDKVQLQRDGKITVRIASQLKDFDPAHYLTPAQINLCDRFSQFAIVAADDLVRAPQLVE